MTASHQPQPDPTLVVQLEGPKAIILEGPEVDGDGVGGASDDLPLHQECLVGQDGQGGAVHSTNGEQLPLRQVHTLHLELHPVAGVDCHVVCTLQEVVEEQRWVVTGVDVPFGVGEADAAESWRNSLSLGHREQLRGNVADGLWGGTGPLGKPVFSCPHPPHCGSFSFSSRIT